MLHRRSLLDRTRYLYNLEVAYLNNHFFLLKMVTSAGMKLFAGECMYYYDLQYANMRAAIVEINVCTICLEFHEYVDIIIGAYVKEFVHGDFGRTTPSISEVLNTQVLLL